MTSEQPYPLSEGNPCSREDAHLPHAWLPQGATADVLTQWCPGHTVQNPVACAFCGDRNHPTRRHGKELLTPLQYPASSKVEDDQFTQSTARLADDDPEAAAADLAEFDRQAEERYERMIAQGRDKHVERTEFES